MNSFYSKYLYGFFVFQIFAMSGYGESSSPQPAPKRIVVSTSTNTTASINPLVALRASEILGTKLPASATEIKFTKLENLFMAGYWVAAKMPREDFLGIVQKLALEKKPDVAEIWPYAFAPPSLRENNGWWNITPKANEDTYFGRKEKPAFFIMAKYENGKMFFKKAL